jgi:hypothetical protein
MNVLLFPYLHIIRYGGSKLFSKTTKFQNPKLKLTPMFIKINTCNGKWINKKILITISAYFSSQIPSVFQRGKENTSHFH